MGAPTETRLFDRCTPLALAGHKVQITPTYRLIDETGTFDLITYDPKHPVDVFVAVEGPRVKLEPADVAGVYPAPGSTNSPAMFLAHIALNRRTLPWERTGPDGVNPPWVALLLVRQSDLPAGTRLDQVVSSTTVAALN